MHPEKLTAFFIFMEQETIEKLMTKYANYENSRQFILASIILFNHMDSKQIKSFIDQTFSNNNINNCYSGTFNGLSKHWQNVAITKLKINDYNSYLRSMSNSNRFYAISRMLLNEGY
jgi:hypothetical protein